METVGDFKIPQYADSENTGWASEENLNAHALATICHGLRAGTKVGTASHYLKDITGGVELYKKGEPDVLIATISDTGVLTISEIQADTLNLPTTDVEVLSLTAGEAVIGTVSNNTTFEADGTPKFNGDATTWEDENFDPTMLTGGGNLPSLISLGSTGLHIAGFSGSQTDEVEFCKEYPHKAKLNPEALTNVKLVFHCHCHPSTAGGGNIRLGLEYASCIEGMVVGSSTTIYLTGALPTTAWERKTFNFANITAPEVLGAQLHFRFFRVPTDPADTYAGALAVATIGFHYEADSLGSHQVTVK